MRTNNCYLLIIILLLVLLAIVSVVSARRVKKSDDWMIAGHCLGLIPSIGTYFATIVSSASVISYVGYYYSVGWGGWWNVAGTPVTSLLAVIFFAAKLKCDGKTTIPEYIEYRYGKTEALMSSILILIASVFLLCSQIKGGALVLQVASGWTYAICVIVISATFILLTVLGGMYSVAWTDTVCSVFMISGIWMLAILLLRKNGGFIQTQESLYTMDPKYLDPVTLGYPMIASWVFTWGVGNYGAPHFITRFFAAKDERTAKISQGWCALLLLLFFTALALIGTSGIVAYPGIEKQDQVTITLIQHVMSPLLGGFMMAAIVATCISTADSVLLLSGTTASYDICRRYFRKNNDEEKLLLVSRSITVVIGVLGIVLSLYENDAIMWIQARAITLMGSALAPSIMFGLAWKGANKHGGMISFVTGLGTAIMWYILDQPFNMMPMLPAFIVGSISLVIGSLFTANNGTDMLVVEE